MISRMIDVSVYVLKEILEYRIVGVVDCGSPSIYVDDSELYKIIDNSSSGYGYGYSEDMSIMDSASLYDYSMYQDKLKIVKGSLPIWRGC